MTPKPKYPAQLIAMVPEEMKAMLKAEAEEREVSIGEVVRDYLQLGITAKNYTARWMIGTPDGPEVEFTTEMSSSPRPIHIGDLGVLRAGDRVTIEFPDPETARDAEEQIERNRLDALDADDDDGPSLREHAANLPADTEPEEVDGTLAAHGQDAPQSLRVARRRPRGIT